MTLKPSRLPLSASLGGVSQDKEMTSGEVAVAWTFSGGRLGTEEERFLIRLERTIMRQYLHISTRVQCVLIHQQIFERCTGKKIQK